MLFSIVIPTCNRVNLLAKCLDALAVYMHPQLSPSGPFQVEIVVSDDSTNDDTKILLQRSYKKCIYNKGPCKGAAANRNSGAFLARGQWIVFIDDDCIPHQGILESYYNFIGTNDVLEGRTISVGKRESVDQECPINEVGGYLWSCNFAIKNDVFVSLSGFNESYQKDAMEDVDFHMRVKKANLRSSFVSTATVSHPWRQEKGKAFRRQQAINTAYYVSLYPEERYKFKSAFAVLSLFRSIYHVLRTCIKLRSLKGFGRMIYLKIYLFLKTWSLIRV